MSSALSPSARVKRNFSRGAASYDGAAGVQAAAAEELSRLLELSAFDAAPSALELGCGTGLLTARLLKRLPEKASLLASDLSPAMLSACASKFPSEIASGRLRLEERDFNDASSSGQERFELVASSMAFQWGLRLDATLGYAARALKPGGTLLFSLPLEESFTELKAAFREAGVPFPGLPLPGRAALDAALASCAFANVHVESLRLSDGCVSMLDALRRFSALGALHLDEPMPAAPLRRVLKLSEGRVFDLDYSLALCRCS